MLHFIIITLAVAMGVVLGSLLLMLIMLALISSSKFMAMLLKYYFKALQKSMTNLDKEFEGMDL